METEFEEFFHSTQPLLAAFNMWADEYQPPAIADHICYKCGNSSEFHAWRSFFESRSRWMFQSFISGRRIANFMLHIPLATSLGPIRFLELNDVKPDQDTPGKWDHIEIYPAKKLADLVDHLVSQGVEMSESGNAHHPTRDIVLVDRYRIRIEETPLVATMVSDMLRTPSELTEGMLDS